MTPPARPEHDEADSTAAIRNGPAHPGGAHRFPPVPPVDAHIRPRWTLPQRLVERLTPLGKLSVLPAGTVFMREGDPPDQIYLIQSGQVRGYVSDDADRRLVLGEAGAGEYCGEVMIDGLHRCMSSATADATRLVAIPRAAFMQALADDHDLLLHVMRKLAMRVRTSSELVRRLALTTVRERVRHFLAETVTAQNDPSAPIRLSQLTIGDRVRATRSMVHRVLKNMSADGEISHTPEGIVLERLPLPPPSSMPLHAPHAPPSAIQPGAGDKSTRPNAQPPAATPEPAPQRNRDALQVLPTDLIDEVCARGKAVHYAPGTTVIFEKTPADSFCVIVRGRLLVTLSSTNGRSFTLGELGPGEYLGEVIVLQNSLRLATAIAQEPSEVIHLSSGDFLALLEHRSDFAKHVAVRLAIRVRQLTHLAKQLALLDVQSRTLSLLRAMGIEHSGGSLLVARPPSQQDIGDRVGASRSMINRVMRDLIAQGVIEQRNGAVVIRPEKGA